MYFWDIIKKSLPEKSIGTMFDEFANNIKRPPERTGQPALRPDASGIFKQPSAKQMIRDSFMGELIKREKKEHGQMLPKEPMLFDQSEAMQFFKLQSEMCLGLTIQTVFSKNPQTVESFPNTYTLQPLDESEVRPQNPVYTRPNLSTLSSLDPLYLQSTPQPTLLAFQFEISSSRDDFLDRINLLSYNLDLVSMCEQEIVRSNSQVMMRGIEGVSEVDESSLEAIKKVVGFRRGCLKSWQCYQNKWGKIRKMVQDKKRIQSKLNFIRVFRQGVGLVFATRPIQNDSQALKTLQSVYQNLKKLQDSKDKLTVPDKIMSLKNIKNTCEIKISEIKKWTKQKFIQWLSKNDNSLIGVFLIWMFLQYKMNETGLAQKIIESALKSLQQQINRKINNSIELNKLVNSLLEPIVRTVSRLNELQEFLQRKQIPRLSHFALKLLKNRGEIFVKYCNELNFNYFKSRKQKFVLSVLQQLNQVKTEPSIQIYEYLKGNFSLVFSQIDSKQSLQRLLNKFK